MFLAEQHALARVGIILKAGNFDGTYYGVSGDPAGFRRRGIGLVLASWTAGYPTWLGFYRHVDVGYYYLPRYDVGVGSLRDPTVDQVLQAARHGAAGETDWQAVNRVVAAAAIFLPVVWQKDLYYRNPRMTNVTCDNALASGIYDFVNVGVR
jgi:peptide/nickel transport system substrate-binding protein